MKNVLRMRKWSPPLNFVEQSSKRQAGSVIRFVNMVVTGDMNKRSGEDKKCSGVD